LIVARHYLLPQTRKVLAAAGSCVVAAAGFAVQVRTACRSRTCKSF
jgi:hypothetical protein